MNKRAQSVGALCVGVITRASSFPGSARALACKFRRLAEIRFFNLEAVGANDSTRGTCAPRALFVATRQTAAQSLPVSLPR